ncbi:PREDICTED: uncharacterized protein LOC104592485 isoform X2 [Nelumbo nucifera]|uniref:Uncharacterized protein LOC104592485 isoform X2 n=1 Tax=Nelumbo nucifera TaxID=4432 RepID=A0A1U7ZNK1_NELNU|nr:PREDICTED: uncharacterized protein LOC104592485 isoform X2 [Nelumbo nucifera]
MLTIECDGKPRLSDERPLGGRQLFSPLLHDGLPRRSFTYQKLPQQLFKLTILKLDDVEVARMASVAELKQAIEDVFSVSPKEEHSRISWSHVWGHFCLCFEGQKLINDKAYLRNFGIKDGDQLHFIRHLSINYRPMKRRSKHHISACEGHTTRSSPGLNAPEDKEQHVDDDDHDDKGCNDNEENDKNNQYEDDEGQYLIGHSELKLAHFLRGWLSYSRLRYSGRKRTQGKTHPRRFVIQFLNFGAKATWP